MKRSQTRFAQVRTTKQVFSESLQNAVGVVLGPEHARRCARLPERGAANGVSGHAAATRGAATVHLSAFQHHH